MYDGRVGDVEISSSLFVGRETRLNPKQQVL